MKLLAAYTALGFVTIEILYFGVWCRPFSNYWALPTPNLQCSEATNHLITNAVFNISSDGAMLAIAAYLFVGSKLEWKRKVILSGVFGLGAFVMLSAVLNKYYSFTHLTGTEWTYWYVRESSTAIVVANLPFLWTLLRRLFNLESFVMPDKQAVKQLSLDVEKVPFSPRCSTESDTRSATQNALLQSDLAFSALTLPLQPPTSAAALDLAAKRKSKQQRPWKERGVYGRDDLDLMEESWEKDLQTSTSTAVHK